MDDIEQWQKVEFLVEAGFRFASQRTPDGTVPYPKTLEEAKTFVLTHTPPGSRRR